MPLLRPSPSDYTTVVKSLANAGAAVTNPQGSRPPSKGSVAFVNVASVAALIRGSPRLASIAPIIRPIVPIVAAVPTLPIDPNNYTVYQTSLVFSYEFQFKTFTCDTAGNFYYRAGGSGGKFFKRTPGGTETFLAGDGNQTPNVFTPGLGAAATFGNLLNISKYVVDSSGNLFAVHTSTRRIIKIEPNGNVTSYAGTGTAGYNDGPVATATFTTPVGIAIDASNTLYVSEQGRKTIRKITSDGQVSTLTFSLAFNPTFYSIAVDSLGVIYAFDTLLYRVYKITPTGPTTADIAFLAGSTQGYADGQGSAARFNIASDSGICVDKFGNVYIGDFYNGSVRKISPSGNVITIAGNGILGSPDSNTQLAYPGGVFVDTNGVVYVSGNNVRKITPVS